MTDSENEFLTRVGPGTPMGKLMRQYWIPVLQSADLPLKDGPPLRVRLLGENLVAFRNTDGKIGLIDQVCPHRCASLFFGRNEANGLRCLYHGWKFDVDGRCQDVPNEPFGSKMHESIRATAYPCVEKNGIVWTYLPAIIRPRYRNWDGHWWTRGAGGPCGISGLATGCRQWKAILTLPI